MLTHYLTTHTILAGLAVAQQSQSQTYSDTITAGSLYGSMADDSGSEQDRERFAQANQNPNITKSIEFAPFFLNRVFPSGQQRA